MEAENHLLLFCPYPHLPLWSCAKGIKASGSTEEGAEASARFPGPLQHTVTFLLYQE